MASGVLIGHIEEVNKHRYAQYLKYSKTRKIYYKKSMMVIYEVLLHIDDKGLTSLKGEYEERVATIDFLTHQDVHLAYRHLLSDLVSPPEKNNGAEETTS